MGMRSLTTPPRNLCHVVTNDIFFQLSVNEQRTFPLLVRRVYPDLSGGGSAHRLDNWHNLQAETGWLQLPVISNPLVRRMAGWRGEKPASIVSASCSILLLFGIHCFQGECFVSLKKKHG